MSDVTHPAGRAGWARSWSPSDWALLVLLALCWGGSFLFYKVLISAMSPLTAIFGRLAIAATALNAVLVARGGRLPKDGASWRALLLLGLINNVLPFWLFAWSELRITSGVAAVLNATAPVFVLLLSATVGDRDVLRGSRQFALGAALTGLAIVVWPSLGARNADMPAIGAGLLAAFLYACASLFAARLPHLPSLTMATGQATAAAAIAGGLCLATRTPLLTTPTTMAMVAALLGIGLLSTALAYHLYFRLLRRIGPSNAQMVTMLVPVCSLMLGWVLLDERLNPAVVVGMVPIGLSLVVLSKPRQS